MRWCVVVLIGVVYKKNWVLLKILVRREIEKVVLPDSGLIELEVNIELHFDKILILLLVPNQLEMRDLYVSMHVLLGTVAP